MYERSGRLAVGVAISDLAIGVSVRDGVVAVVEPGLRIEPEPRILVGCVAGVGADHGEPRFRALSRGAPPVSRPAAGMHDAVEAAVGLVEEAAVPGQRQAHLESDRIALAIDLAPALVHAAGDEAMLGTGRDDPILLERPGRDHLRAGHPKSCEAESLSEAPAGFLGRCGRCRERALRAGAWIARRHAGGKAGERTRDGKDPRQVAGHGGWLAKHRLSPHDGLASRWPARPQR